MSAKASKVKTMDKKVSVQNNEQTDAYIEGVFDHEDGVPASECPYHRAYFGDSKPIKNKPSNRQQWFSGWYDSYLFRKYPHLFSYPITHEQITTGKKTNG